MADIDITMYLKGQLKPIASSDTFTTVTDSVDVWASSIVISLLWILALLMAQISV